MPSGPKKRKTARVRAKLDRGFPSSGYDNGSSIDTFEKFDGQDLPVHNRFQGFAQAQSLTGMTNQGPCRSASQASKHHPHQPEPLPSKGGKLYSPTAVRVSAISSGLSHTKDAEVHTLLSDESFQQPVQSKEEDSHQKLQQKSNPGHACGAPRALPLPTSHAQQDMFRACKVWPQESLVLVSNGYHVIGGGAAANPGPQQNQLLHVLNCEPKEVTTVTSANGCTALLTENEGLHRPQESTVNNKIFHNSNSASNKALLFASDSHNNNQEDKGSVDKIVSREETQWAFRDYSSNTALATDQSSKSLPYESTNQEPAASNSKNEILSDKGSHSGLQLESSGGKKHEEAKVSNTVHNDSSSSIALCKGCMVSDDDEGVGDEFAIVSQEMSIQPVVLDRRMTANGGELNPTNKWWGCCGLYDLMMLKG